MVRISVAVFHWDPGREAAVSGLTRALVAVLPIPSGDTLVAACNRYRVALAECGLNVPRVEAVDPVQGAVTMRKACVPALVAIQRTSSRIRSRPRCCIMKDENGYEVRVREAPESGTRRSAGWLWELWHHARLIGSGETHGDEGAARGEAMSARIDHKIKQQGD